MGVGGEGGSKEERWWIANGGARVKLCLPRAVRRDMKAGRERAEPTGAL